MIIKRKTRTPIGVSSIVQAYSYLTRTMLALYYTPFFSVLFYSFFTFCFYYMRPLELWQPLHSYMHTYIHTRSSLVCHTFFFHFRAVSPHINLPLLGYPLPIFSPPAWQFHRSKSIAFSLPPFLPPIFNIFKKPTFLSNLENRRFEISFSSWSYFNLLYISLYLFS